MRVCLICKDEFMPRVWTQKVCYSDKDREIIENLYNNWMSERGIAKVFSLERGVIRNVMRKYQIKPRARYERGNPKRLGHKPWTFGLTVKTSPKLKAIVEKGAAKKRGVKQDPEIVQKRAEGIRRNFQEHPERRLKLRENGLKLAQSPYHHRRVPGEYTLPQESRDKTSRTLKKRYRDEPEFKQAACEALERARAKMGLGRGPTQPEIKVENLLKLLNITAVSQYRLNGFFIDFALPEQKLAILVDGCFWHCCPIHKNRAVETASFRWQRKPPLPPLLTKCWYCVTI